MSHAGAATGAFVAAFPLDRRFGLIKGFETYGDKMPRGADGRLANERAGQAVVDEALQWLDNTSSSRSFCGSISSSRILRTAIRRIRCRRNVRRAPGTTMRSPKPIVQVGRLLEGLGETRSATMIVVAGDHGEAFGEHGEITHSIFTYDTTLRVPLIMSGVGVSSHGGIVKGDVSLVTSLPRSGGCWIGSFDADGIDLSPVLAGGPVPARALYAESFAPLFDFGWSPLRTIRQDGWKYVAAPHPELYHVRTIPERPTTESTRNRSGLPTSPGESTRFDRGSATRKHAARSRRARAPQALGYVSAGKSTGARRIRRIGVKKPRGWRRSRRESSTGPRSSRRSQRIILKNDRRQSPGKRATGLPGDGCRTVRARPCRSSTARSRIIFRPRTRISGSPDVKSRPGTSPPPNERYDEARRSNPTIRCQRESRARALGQRHLTDAIPYLQRALTSIRTSTRRASARGGLCSGGPPRRRRSQASELLRRLPPTRRSGPKSNDCWQPSADSGHSPRKTVDSPAKPSHWIVSTIKWLFVSTPVTSVAHQSFPVGDSSH